MCQGTASSCRGWSQRMKRGHYRTIWGGSKPPSPRPPFIPSPATEPHTLIFSVAPGPGQEDGWSLEGGGLSDPQLLKRANREVKIGNKNKIAPAWPWLFV